MALKDRERREIKQNQSTKVLDNDKYLVVIPKTYKSIQVYGAGTKWCFNTDDENIFNSYNDLGLLFIIINKLNNEKFILHLETEGIKDVLCQEIQYKDFWEEHPVLRELFLQLLQNDTYKQYRESEKIVIEQFLKN